jgi:hypothetical protein
MSVGAEGKVEQGLDGGRNDRGEGHDADQRDWESLFGWSGAFTVSRPNVKQNRMMIS